MEASACSGRCQRRAAGNSYWVVRYRIPLSQPMLWALGTSRRPVHSPHCGNGCDCRPLDIASPIGPGMDRTTSRSARVPRRHGAVLREGITVSSATRACHGCYSTATCTTSTHRPPYSSLRLSYGALLADMERWVESTYAVAILHLHSLGAVVTPAAAALVPLVSVSESREQSYSTSTADARTTHERACHD